MAKMEDKYKNQTKLRLVEDEDSDYIDTDDK